MFIHFWEQINIKKTLFANISKGKIILFLESNNKKLLATLLEVDLKAPFSITTTPKCKVGQYFILWIARLYP